MRTAAELSGLDRLRGAKPLVLVPTMGALHTGHLSLVRGAAGLGPTVVSIFVNPTQFGPGEDLGSYPRDLAADLTLLADLDVAAVFAPGVEAVYGGTGEVTVQPGQRGAGLCSGTRPGHFSGVLTVVAKLFGLVRPDVAVFGRKDAQQCLVIDQMVADLRFGVRLVDLPTVRDADGLAMSSRNRYLSAADRARALGLSRGLTRARQLVSAGERRAEPLVAAMRAELTAVDAVEYVEVRRVPDLAPLSDLDGTVLLAVAARVGQARLIDNVVLKLAGESVAEGCLLGPLFPAAATRAETGARYD